MRVNVTDAETEEATEGDADAVAQVPLPSSVSEVREGDEEGSVVGVSQRTSGRRRVTEKGNVHSRSR